jgi:DNA topoisomerase IA
LKEAFAHPRQLTLQWSRQQARRIVTAWGYKITRSVAQNQAGLSAGRVNSVPQNRG